MRGRLDYPGRVLRIGLTRMAAWASAVALTLAATLGLAGAQDRAAAHEGRLRVLTYNVHGLPAFITGDDTLARQRLIAPHLEPYDVVGLQEDFMSEGHALLVGPTRHPIRLRFAEALEGRVYGAGLTLLARRGQRVDQGTWHDGTAAGLDDSLASKGFQWVRLTLAPGVEVDVYNSHLDAGGNRADQAARAVQVRALTEAMQTASRGRAVVFLGDTNLKPRGQDRETLRAWLAATGLRCACRASREACCARIDRILVRSGVGVELTVDSWGVEPGFTDAAGAPLSDHAPIGAVLRWRRRPL